MTDLLQERLQKNLENIVIYHAKAIVTDKGKFSRNINKVWQKKMYCAELLRTVNHQPFHLNGTSVEWRSLGEMGREKPWLAVAGAPSATAGREVRKDANHLWVFT